MIEAKVFIAQFATQHAHQVSKLSQTEKDDLKRNPYGPLARTLAAIAADEALVQMATVDGLKLAYYERHSK